MSSPDQSGGRGRHALRGGERAWWLDACEALEPGAVALDELEVARRGVTEEKRDAARGGDVHLAADLADGEDERTAAS